MPPGKNETLIVVEPEPIYDPEEGGFIDAAEFPVEKAQQVAADLVTTLNTVGGTMSTVCQRERVGEIEGRPVFETRRMIFRWHRYAPTERLESEGQEVGEVREEEPEPAQAG